MKSATVSKQTSGKIGLVGSICIIISTVVGVGVFFKNQSVFINNNGNAIGVLLSWILAAIIALFTAFSYAEIVSVKGLKNANAGLAGWAGKISGYNFGRHITLTQSSFYYVAKLVAMGTFAAVAIFQIYFAALGQLKFTASLIGVDDRFTGLIVMCVGIAIIFIFMTANLLSNKFGSGFAKGATFIKFLPILMIIIMGLTFGIMQGFSMWNGTQWITPDGLNPHTEPTGQFDITGVFKSIPAILFAFDSFLVIGNVQNQVREPDKNVPLAIVISMICACSAEVLVTVAEITVGSGNPYTVMWIGLHGNQIAFITCVCIISVSIVIAALGVCNSLTMAGIKATQAAIDNQIIFGHRWAAKFRSGSDKLGGFWLFSSYVLFIWAAVMIPTAILNTSHIYDGFSTLAVLFYFGIYGTVILFGLINRKTHKHEVHKVGYFIPIGIIAVFGCYFAFGYCVFYQFSTAVALNPDAAGPFGFGMVRGFNLNNWQSACVFWSAAAFFIAYPFINDLLIKLTNKNYGQPLLWEKAKQSVSIQSSKK